MSAKIWTICNQKGGSGKTTATMQIAGSLSRRDYRVLVADADPQGTATRWAASATDENPFPCAVIGMSNAGGKTHREVAKFVSNYDFILIDCPPAADSPVPQSALLVSDLALVPLVPSPLDLWASVGIREVIARMSDINESLQARLLLNQAQPNLTLTRETLDILPEFGIELCQTQWRQRTAYRQSAVWGQTVHDTTNKAAIDEVESLTSELLQISK